MHAYSADTRNNILALLHQGLSIRQVAERCQVSQSAVQRVGVKHIVVLLLLVAHNPRKLLGQTVRLFAHRMRSKEASIIAKATMSFDTESGVQYQRPTQSRNGAQEKNK
jgi:preprotein translocase subunit SecD